MRWGQSFVAACVIWAIVVVWCRLSVQRESDSLFISWLVFCPFIGFFAGLACRRIPGLAWLGLGSIVLAFGAFFLYEQGWTGFACPSGEEGEYCQLEQLVVWFAGLYALGVAAAIIVGVVVSTALQKRLQCPDGVIN